MKIKKVEELDNDLEDFFNEIRDKFSAHDYELKYYPKEKLEPSVQFCIPRDKCFEVLGIDQPKTFNKHGGEFADIMSIQSRMDEVYNKLIKDDDLLIAIDRVSDKYNISFRELKVYFSGPEILLMLLFKS